MATAVDATLLDTKPTRIRTNVYGPVTINHEPIGALLIGRSSATMKGLQVLTGLIDKDYFGEVQIVVSAMFPPMHIPQGSRIAQLIPLPHLTVGVAPAKEQPRGYGAFGSTGSVVLLTVGMHQRPRQTVTVKYKEESIRTNALLDTGADVSIISTKIWPQHWPTRETSSTVAGVGGVTLARKSSTLQWTIGNKVVNCSVSILPLPEGVQALIGRDILAQMGMVLTSEHPL